MSANGTITLLITKDLRPGAIVSYTILKNVVFIYSPQAFGTIATLSITCVSLLFLNLLINAVISKKAGNRDERIFIRTHVG
jgi:hypothetical protein